MPEPERQIRSCSLSLEDRPLQQGPVKGTVGLHLFLDFTPSYGPTQAIEGLHTGSLLTATVNGDSLFGHGDGEVRGASVCLALPILTAEVSRINAAHIQYNGFGPNSNSATRSAMRYMLQSLSYLMSLFGPWYTIPPIILGFGGYYAPLPGIEATASSPPSPPPPRYHL